MDNEILEITSIFAYEGGLYRAFGDARPFSDWGILNLDKDKRICSEYERRVIPL